MGEADIDSAELQCLELLPRAQVLQFDPGLWRDIQEAFDGRLQGPHRNGTFHEAKRHGARPPLRLIPDAIFQLLRMLDQGLCLGQKLPTRIRQWKPLSLAGEEGRSQSLLQGNDLTAQRRLRYLQQRCRFSNVQRLCNGDEIVEFLELDPQTFYVSYDAKTDIDHLIHYAKNRSKQGYSIEFAEPAAQCGDPTNYLEVGMIRKEFSREVEKQCRGHRWRMSIDL